ncbi:lasso RiPP family leader peptide-containing protein [Saccharopolyspora erythraea]|nr:lasso RiPP family leader peptide-containing protein [Saccharopolyspora erythraea]QUH00862.1 lasso RiPP family leader peptide-containing protein [Saccharopolyspora erythraea]
MDEQMENVESYTPPMLVEVGEFSEDTLGSSILIPDDEEGLL